MYADRNQVQTSVVSWSRLGGDLEILQWDVWAKVKFVRVKVVLVEVKPIFVSVKPLFVVWCVKMWILYYGDGKSATDYFKYLDGVLCL